MGKWANRLAEISATPPCGGTDKTDTRGVLSVLAVTPEGGERNFPAVPMPPDKAEASAQISASEPTQRLGSGEDAIAGTDADMARFLDRRARLLRWGWSDTDADGLAERLTLRDREGDDRRMCVECTHLGERGRCLAAAAGRIKGADRRLEPVQTILQRCEAFGLKKGLT